MRFARLILTTGALAVSGASAAVDFKGIELGQPLYMSLERAVFGKLDCNPLHLDTAEYNNYLGEMQQVFPGVRKVCAGSASIATVPASVTVLLGSSRKVLRLTFQFEASDFPRVFDAMTAKWGQGVSEIRDEFDQSVWWDFDDGSSISLHRTPDPQGESAPGDVLLVGLVEYSLPLTSPASDL